MVSRGKSESVRVPGAVLRATPAAAEEAALPGAPCDAGIHDELTLGGSCRFAMIATRGYPPCTSARSAEVTSPSTDAPVEQHRVEQRRAPSDALTFGVLNAHHAEHPG